MDFPASAYLIPFNHLLSQLHTPLPLKTVLTSTVLPIAALIVLASTIRGTTNANNRTPPKLPLVRATGFYGVDDNGNPIPDRSCSSAAISDHANIHRDAGRPKTPKSNIRSRGIVGKPAIFRATPTIVPARSRKLNRHSPYTRDLERWIWSRHSPISPSPPTNLAEPPIIRRLQQHSVDTADSTLSTTTSTTSSQPNRSTNSNQCRITRRDLPRLLVRLR